MVTKTQSLKDLAKEYSTTAKRVQRVKQAVILSHKQDMTNQEIADELGLSRPETISDYLNSDLAEEFEAPLSSRDTYEVQKEFEERFENMSEEAEDLFEELKGAAEYKDQLRALNELRKVNKDAAEFASDIGALDTEPERHEVEHSGVPQVVINTEPGDEEAEES